MKINLITAVSKPSRRPLEALSKIPGMRDFDLTSNDGDYETYDMALGKFAGIRVRLIDEEGQFSLTALPKASDPWPYWVKAPTPSGKPTKVTDPSLPSDGPTYNYDGLESIDAIKKFLAAVYKEIIKSSKESASAVRPKPSKVTRKDIHDDQGYDEPVYEVTDSARGCLVILDKKRNENISEAKRIIIDSLKGDFDVAVVKDRGTSVVITVSLDGEPADADDVEECLRENMDRVV